MISKNGTIIPTDKEGYLTLLSNWSPDIAELIAKNEGIQLTQQHWEILNLIRKFHDEFELSPAMRPLVKYVRIHLGEEKGKSVYLLKLFPGSPPKLAAKIAGLPRPENCI